MAELPSRGTSLRRFCSSQAARPLCACKRLLAATHSAIDGSPVVNELLATANRLRRRPAATVSVIIPTLGRETLAAAVASASWADEIVLVYDAATLPDDLPAGASAYARGPTADWGATQRRHGMAVATGSHIAFMDDDDVYAPGAGESVRRVLSARPGRVHIFCMLDGDTTYGGRGCVVQGAIGTPMFVIPNDQRLGEWTARYEGDFDFIRSTLAARGARPLFHDEIVALVRSAKRT